jgi:hypothetical protein
MDTKRRYWLMGALALVGSVVLFGALGIWVGLSGYAAEEASHRREAERRSALAATDHGKLREALAKALAEGTTSAWDAADRAIAAIPDQRKRERLQAALLPLPIAAIGDERDRLLVEASTMLARNQSDPRAQPLVDKAKASQDRIERLLAAYLQNPGKFAEQNIDEAEREEWQMTMNYVAGFTTKRGLAFAPPSDKQKIRDHLAKAVREFKANVLIKPDTRTAYAIESLYPPLQKQGSGEDSPKPGARSPPLLQQRTPTSGPAKKSGGV